MHLKLCSKCTLKSGPQVRSWTFSQSNGLRVNSDTPLYALDAKFGSKLTNFEVNLYEIKYFGAFDTYFSKICYKIINSLWSTNFVKITVKCSEINAYFKSKQQLNVYSGKYHEISILYDNKINQEPHGSVQAEMPSSD